MNVSESATRKQQRMNKRGKENLEKHRAMDETMRCKLFINYLSFILFLKEVCHRYFYSLILYSSFLISVIAIYSKLSYYITHMYKKYISSFILKYLKCL